jgi:hypothetical protein
MKKLKLELEDLEVSSFTAEEAVHRRGVHGRDSRYTDFCGTGTGCEPATEYTKCLCTNAEGCYPSKYCSGGGCVITYQEGCMTDNYAAC